MYIYITEYILYNENIPSQKGDNHIFLPLCGKELAEINSFCTKIMVTFYTRA
jgi:hypothetical protein